MVERLASDVTRILHVTEASGGGVLQVVTHLARHQRETGASVSVALTERYDSPSETELSARFADCKVTNLGAGPTLMKLIRIFRFVRHSVRASDVDVIHLHSSFAGLAGRLAALTVGRTGPAIVYSAHAYAFLRSDVPKMVRFLVYVAEKCLSRFSTGTVAISESEATLARQVGPPARVRTLGNCVPIPPLAERTQQRPVVANIGRLVPQKGPERFAYAAERLSDRADFLWIGGPTSSSDTVPMSSTVKVTGHLSHKAALAALSNVSVHLFTSKWEGMPLALMESQAMGIPAIAWECPGTMDVILEGETGFVVSSEEEMLDRLSELLENSTLREELSEKAEKVRSRFSDEGYGSRSLEVYRQLISEVRSKSSARDGKFARG